MNPNEFDWGDFLSLAGQWSASAPGDYAEALFRSIISRAYYAAFHSAEDLALQLGMESTSSASDHYRVRQYFRNRGRVAQQVSSTLSDLYSLRIDADYLRVWDSDIADTSAIAAQKALEMARRVSELLTHLQPKTQK